MSRQHPLTITADQPPRLSHRTIPRQLLLGVILIAVWWPIAWLHLQPLSDYYFFPLWLGYILTIDGIVARRSGTSLWQRSHGRFLLLFVISAPFWWLFEWLNGFLQNWHYMIPFVPSWFQSYLISSLFFSTVVPAVLESVELLATFRVGQRLPRFPAWPIGPRTRVLFELLGWLMLLLIVTVPRYAFPFAWASVFFIVEPLNDTLGQRSIVAFAREGNWAPVWNIALGTLLTGFCWEMWNSQAMPKWYYTVPFVGFAHVFEMPVLGYLGYLSFGLELFAIYTLASWLLRWRGPEYARVGDRPRSQRTTAAPSYGLRVSDQS